MLYITVATVRQERRSHRLISNFPVYGYAFSKKNSSPGSIRSFLITLPRLILKSGYGHELVSDKFG